MQYKIEDNLNHSPNYMFGENQASREEVEIILNKYNLILDEYLIDFIVKTNSSIFKENARRYYPIPNENGFYRLDWIVSTELIENRMLYDTDFVEHYYFVDCLLNLFNTHLEMIHIGYAGEYKDKLYALNYQWNEFDDDYSKMIVKVADSLEEFLSKLITYDELPEEHK